MTIVYAGEVEHRGGGDLRADGIGSVPLFAQGVRNLAAVRVLAASGRGLPIVYRYESP